MKKWYIDLIAGPDRKKKKNLEKSGWKEGHPSRKTATKLMQVLLESFFECWFNEREGFWSGGKQVEEESRSVLFTKEST